MQKGQIGVTTENIFPVIKKFLYSDNEIFLRELVANAIDATQKLKTLSSFGEYKGELGEMRVEVKVDKEAGTLTVTDRGIGMTADDINKYINQIAFSGAEEFVNKYKDNANSIIGHFGLGFYSAFMVSSKVEIRSLSYKEGAEAVSWTCDGSPEYTMEPCDKSTRGTEITLWIDDDNKEYLEQARIDLLLKKYCRFLPVPVVSGKEQEWKDGKYVDTDRDKVINATEPAWTKKPSELTDEDYRNFYHEIDGYLLYGSGDRLRRAASRLIRLAKLHPLHLHGTHAALVVGQIFDGVAEGHELYALFLSMLHLLNARGHLGLAATIDYHRSLGPLTTRGAHGVHGGVASSDDGHAAALEHGGVLAGTAGTHEVDAGEIFVARHDSDVVFSGYAHEARKSGSRGNKDAFVSECVEVVIGENLAYDAILDKPYSESAQTVNLSLDHAVGESELGDAILKHSAYLVKSLVDGNVIAALDHIAGKGESGGA